MSLLGGVRGPLPLTCLWCTPLRLSSWPVSIAAGAAAHDRCLAKQAYYGQACRREGWDFVPCAVETTGAWSHPAQRMIIWLAKRVAISLGAPVKQLLAEAWTEASSVVARSVGAMLAHCAPCGGLGLSVGTYAPTSSFRISAISPLPGTISPVGAHPPADVHAPYAAPAESHRVAVASTSSAPPQPLN